MSGGNREFEVHRKTLHQVCMPIFFALRNWVVPLALTSLLARSALAWGTEGHRVIANLTEQGLNPKAKQEVRRLLALEPGSTLASISTWADEHRNPTTAAWHYVNFPKTSCTYEAQRDCPDGNCVVAAIDRQLEILASSVPDEKRLLALTPASYVGKAVELARGV